MNKIWITLYLALIAMIVLGLGYSLSVLQTKYNAQSRDIQTMNQQIKSLKQEIFYLQSMNYSEYLITKKHWEVIRRTYKNQNSLTSER